MSHDDFDFEPIRGLPAALPPGEQLLWQGSPDWKSLAVRAYHVRKVAIYFGALVAYRVGMGVVNGHTAGAIAVSCAFLVVLGAVAIGVLAALAYFTSRATVYSITSRRVLLRHGIAVPMTMNVPFTMIDSAAYKHYADGTGDIALQVPREQRIGYLITWPHLRPGYLAQPQPSLRAVRDSQVAADVLSTALAAAAGTQPVKIEDTVAPGTEPVSPARRPGLVATSQSTATA